MAANMQKIKLLKLYELLRKETDETHPISRVELCRRLNEMGISSNVRTLSLDIEAMQENGFEIMSYRVGSVGCQPCAAYAVPHHLQRYGDPQIRTRSRKGDLP